MKSEDNEIYSVLYMMNDLCQGHMERNKHECEGCPLKIPVGIPVPLIDGIFYESCFRKILWMKKHKFGMPPMPKESEEDK